MWLLNDGVDGGRNWFSCRVVPNHSGITRLLVS